MSRALPIRRTLAATAAAAVAVWGAAALPAAAADPGQGQGQGQGQSKHAGKAEQGKGDKGDKGHQGHQGHQGKNDGKGHQGKNDSKGQGKGTGQGPKEDNGPKDGNGNGDPAGNNGTVKIAPLGEMDGIPNNSPHPGCTFQIEWYGFDEGADIFSTVEFAMHSPTADVALSGTEPREVFVGEDPATGAGTDTGLDAVQPYTLAFDGEPHPKQGYHVKLTIHTDGSQGADTKHKVFWVEPCETETEESPAEDEQGEDEQGEDEGDEDGERDDAEVLGEQAGAGSEDDDTEVMGAQAEAPAAADDEANVPNAVDAGEEGGFVGALTSPLGLTLVLAGLALAGLGFMLRRRVS